MIREIVVPPILIRDILLRAQLAECSTANLPLSPFLPACARPPHQSLGRSALSIGIGVERESVIRAPHVLPAPLDPDSGHILSQQTFDSGHILSQLDVRLGTCSFAARRSIRDTSTFDSDTFFRCSILIREIMSGGSKLEPMPPAALHTTFTFVQPRPMHIRLSDRAPPASSVLLEVPPAANHNRP